MSACFPSASLGMGCRALGDVSIYLSLQPRNSKPQRVSERENPHPRLPSPWLDENVTMATSQHASLPLAGENPVSPKCQNRDHVAVIFLF